MCLLGLANTRQKQPEAIRSVVPPSRSTIFEVFWLHSSRCCKSAHSFVFLNTFVDNSLRITATASTVFHRKHSICHPVRSTLLATPQISSKAWATAVSGRTLAQCARGCALIRTIRYGDAEWAQRKPEIFHLLMTQQVLHNPKWEATSFTTSAHEPTSTKWCGTRIQHDGLEVLRSTYKGAAVATLYSGDRNGSLWTIIALHRNLPWTQLMSQQLQQGQKKVKKLGKCWYIFFRVSFWALKWTKILYVLYTSVCKFYTFVPFCATFTTEI